MATIDAVTTDGSPLAQMYSTKPCDVNGSRGDAGVRIYAVAPKNEPTAPPIMIAAAVADAR